MKFEIEIDNSVSLSYEVEYRVKVIGLNDTENIGLGASPGAALDEALYDALLERDLGQLVTK